MNSNYYKKIIKQFEMQLTQEHLSSNTIRSYLFVVYRFYNLYTEINETNVLAFQHYLERHYSVTSANLRIIAFNRFLYFIGKIHLKLKRIKFSQPSFLDKMISYEEYKQFRMHLSSQEEKKWFYIVWVLASTGVRISELVQFQKEDIVRGFIDVRAKGNKIRRVFIPQSLQIDISLWLDSQGILSGPVFRNRSGRAISIRGISKGLERKAKEFGIEPHIVYPHAFRHLFAKKFLERNGDITLLADLLGHESLDTTKIYLRRSSDEQKEIINKIVEW